MRYLVRTTVVIVLLLLGSLQIIAGDFILTNNRGTNSDTFFISGEPTLVMNGFDLTPRNITLPTQLDRVSIDVVTAVPGQQVEVVIYEDFTSGSPIDANLIFRRQVDITQAGIYTLTLEDPVTISAPVVWVGFYLPVDFVFRADTSGSSTLTYWAWEPGGRFDVANLASASVFGPGNGTAPVNINMGGIARITAELITDGTGTQLAPPTTTTTTQTTVRQRGRELVDTTVPPVVRNAEGRIIQAEGGNVDLSFVLRYAGSGDERCTRLYYDSYDVRVTYRSFVQFFCKSVPVQFAPANPMGYVRVGALYDVYAFNIDQGLNSWPDPVTHCILTPAADLTRAVIGFGQGSPRQWQILPSVRYGDVVCAEIPSSGFVSYFLPV